MRTRHIRIEQQNKGTKPRHGFSLLEVILSLSLAIILFGAVFAAVNQSWRLTASGREEMARAQIVRALLRKIEVDIRSVMFTPTPSDEMEEDSVGSTSTGTGASSTGSTGSTSGTGSSTSGTGTTNQQTTTSSSTTIVGFVEEEPSSRSRGILGSATQLDLHISRARRDLNFATSVDGLALQSRTSDLLAVSYFMGQSGTSSSSGLMRSEGDRLMVTLVEDEGGVSTSLRKTQVLAPEVASIGFRYFSGTSWFDQWDSETNGFLPRAIEITITLFPPKTQGGIMTNVLVSDSFNQFRSVISVPVADPLPMEMLP